MRYNLLLNPVQTIETTNFKLRKITKLPRKFLSFTPSAREAGPLRGIRNKTLRMC